LGRKIEQADQVSGTAPFGKAEALEQAPWKWKKKRIMGPVEDLSDREKLGSAWLEEACPQSKGRVASCDVVRLKSGTPVTSYIEVSADGDSTVRKGFASLLSKPSRERRFGLTCLAWLGFRRRNLLSLASEQA
jgi:hypothetical protein